MKGAALLEEAGGQSSSGTQIKMEEQVRRLQIENQHLKSKFGAKQPARSNCRSCGKSNCGRGNKCPAYGQQCSRCHGFNHYARVCENSSRDNSNPRWKSKGRRNRVSKLDDGEQSDSDESLGCIETVNHLNGYSIRAKVYINGAENGSPQVIELATDTGVLKTLLNIDDWMKINSQSKIVQTTKSFRPYGTDYRLPMVGKAKVVLRAENGAEIRTWVYIVNDHKETSLLGNADATRLGIVKLDLKGASEEVRSIEYIPKSISKDKEIISGGETQKEIDSNMEAIVKKYPDVFTDKTGKYTGKPIKIHVNPNAVPVIQSQRRVPLQYRDRLKKEIDRMLAEDIIEGPIEVEEPGTLLSNVVIVDKRDAVNIRITLDCQEVNKEIYQTHEPMPTVEELRHELDGSDRFSVIDVVNCFNQFEIVKSARKLFSFFTPWGIMRFKRMVPGCCPASSEIQKKISTYKYICLASSCDDVFAWTHLKPAKPFHIHYVPK